MVQVKPKFAAFTRLSEHFNQAVQADPAPDNRSERRSLVEAMAWCEQVEYARQVCEACCESWRRVHIHRVSKEHRGAALKCIEEIERHIPLLRSGRLADVPEQRAAMDRCVLISAKLAVYADDLKALRLYSSSIVGDSKDETQAVQKVAAFSRAIIGDDLRGQKDWLRQSDSLHCVVTETSRLASMYDKDGQLDSTGKVIHERAILDPLYPHAQDFDEPYELVKASLEMAEHPAVHIEIENLEEAFKAAGLRPSQRKALMMRRNSKTMSREDVNEWKRSQRAISRHRSQLIAAITAATKTRVIRAPMISAGNFSRVIREGAGYTLPLPNEDKPTRNRSDQNQQAPRWFHSTPPPIRPISRKTKHLFKKAST